MLSRRKKLLFVLPNLEGGGTHRVILTLASQLDREKFEIAMIVVMDSGEFRNLLPKDIQTIFLGVDWLPKGYFKILKAIHEIEPDVIFSATGHLNLMVLSLKKLLPSSSVWIIRESGNLSMLLDDPHYGWNSRIMKGVFRLVYPLADRIVCQSNFMLEDLESNFSVPSPKLSRIYNPLNIDHIAESVSQSNNPYLGFGHGPHIVSAGRLTYAKNFELLIKVFAKYYETVDTAMLWIIGEGPLRKHLEEVSKEMGLDDVVYMPGFQHNPYPWFHHADLFVLTSIYEGLPNVLLEALACGCPVVAPNCPGGIREIMELTQNEGRLMNHDCFEIKQHHFDRSDSSNARQLLKRNFGMSGIINDYTELILSVGTN